MSDGKLKKLGLLETNYKRAAINIGRSIIDKIELSDTVEKLEREIESAANDYITLLNNYRTEKEKSSIN
ncbi:MAG TPA: hypothetical protein PLG34_11125 [Spirochaetota bacterium]|jgi:hypothetical protein|nr:MAG: hypothetical protein BWX91_01226 [Spirochaetes bacterium ADurb.Bin133]HNZ26864.1 hypothetical protein [Spirochaetota bacterium]HPY88521.1 hypothetical protein [Spirochaetota bacterium]HQB60910.1 hypothetical protein [Spirochaetota bacterium]